MLLLFSSSDSNVKNVYRLRLNLRFKMFVLHTCIIDLGNCVIYESVDVDFAESEKIKTLNLEP